MEPAVEVGDLVDRGLTKGELKERSNTVKTPLHYGENVMRRELKKCL